MSCGCTKPEKAALWTPIPEYRQPTDIQKGENIDCYIKRAGNPTGEMSPAPDMDANRISNTSLVADLTPAVNVKMEVTPGSLPVTWAPLEIKENGAVITIPGMSIDSNGQITVSKAALDPYVNRNFKVLVTANFNDGSSDAREFNFFPKVADKDGTIKFVVPLDGNPIVTCKFGPRKAPVPGASTVHKGMDFALAGGALGNILAAADGTVVRCGPGSGWGNVIFIEHNDAQGRLVATTVYGHWSQAYVAQGQKVAAGQKIAKEGHEGIGSGAHLHFEMHKGKFGNPVDPAPYLNGTVVPSDAGAGQDGSTSVSHTNAGMTSKEAANSNADCPGSTSGAPLQQPPPGSEDTTVTPSPTKTKCVPTRSYTGQEIYDIINAECASAGLNADETQFIRIVAKIESGLDPAAKNPTSSATGLFQMLDSIAAKYYGDIGVSPTCENRIDPTYATKAMIQFFKSEFRPYYAGFVSSGHTKIANKTIKDTAWSQTYSSLSMGAFMYGLIHHDGVGTAVSGIDKGGVGYWKQKGGA
jgi:hypothetical protein